MERGGEVAGVTWETGRNVHQLFGRFHTARERHTQHQLKSTLKSPRVAKEKCWLTFCGCVSAVYPSSAPLTPYPPPVASQHDLRKCVFTTHWLGGIHGSHCGCGLCPGGCGFIQSDVQCAGIWLPLVAVPELPDLQ